MPSAAEDIADLVADEFLHLGAGSNQVFARIEFLWILGHDLADAGGECEAEVGVDIDLGAAGAAGDFNVSFRNASGILAELAAVLVNFGDEILGHAGGTVEDQGVIAETGF